MTTARGPGGAAWASSAAGYIILILLLALAAAGWALLVWERAPMTETSLTMGMGAGLFLAIWIVMMVAMMLPSAAPMVLTFQRVQAGRRRAGQAFVATWLFVAGYLLVWSASGIVAYAGALAAQAVSDVLRLPAATLARIGGGVFVLAGIYQLTPIKAVCLAQCRSPAGFIMTSWRDGAAGALQMGLRHGLYCLGCCWLLFVILFPLGLMNLVAMALIAAVVFAEKTLPWAAWPARVTAVLLIAYGLVVILAPQALQTFGPAAVTSMPM